MKACPELFQGDFFVGSEEEAAAKLLNAVTEAKSGMETGRILEHIELRKSSAISVRDEALFKFARTTILAPESYEPVELLWSRQRRLL